jgi:hypothetical protein
LCERDDWSYISREELRLRVFEERMQQKIFGFTSDNVREDLRGPHNEDVHDIYLSLDRLLIFSRTMRWAGHVAHMGDRRGTYRVLVERP